jgi:hypothetical protein
MTPLIDKLLWSGSSVAPAESPHDFQDEMLEEVHAAASLAFSNSAQRASRGSDPKEPAIYLYCPYNNSNAVVDAAVKHLAFRHEADVVVLDASELARGKYGALGTGKFFLAFLPGRKSYRAFCRAWGCYRKTLRETPSFLSKSIIFIKWRDGRGQ